MTPKSQRVLELVGAVLVCIGMAALGYSLAGVALAVAFVGIVAGGILIFLGNV